MSALDETRRRGQPLVFLVALLLGWIAARVLLWEGLGLPDLPLRIAAAPLASRPALAVQTGPYAPSPAAAALPGSAGPVALADVNRLLPPAPAIAAPEAVPAPAPLPGPPAPLPVFALGGTADSVAGGTALAGAHQLAWMAGVAQLPVPLFIRDRLSDRDRRTGLVPAEARSLVSAGRKRWSVDGWLLLRRGGEGLSPGGLPSPSYGESQAGAVVRYRLAPDSRHRPALFLRATTALGTPRGEEVALGAAVRPVAQLPLSLQAELRATRLAGGTVLRPAVGLVTELAPIALPAGFSAEVYGQAGYVDGPAASGYAEGQFRLDRRVARIGSGELRLGAGAWGGVQRGASRIDLGPAAVLDFPLGQGRGRIAADWRLRVAGNAAPTSGPAVTLSAGF